MNRKTKKVVVIFLGICVVAAAFLVFKNKANLKMMSLNGNKEISYTIPNVPYYGLYNNKKGYSNDFVAGTVSIFDYWEKNAPESAEVNKSFSQVSALMSAGSIVDYFSMKNFSTRVAKLSLSDIGEYINPQVRTPLITFLPTSVDQPGEVEYYPAVVLIGINNEEQKITLHSYWLGNNYELSFGDFKKLQERMPIDQRNEYVIIQPNNLQEKLKEISQVKVENYPIRTSLMRNSEQMFKNYAIGYGAYALKEYDDSIDYLDKVAMDSNFESSMPPYFKVRVFYGLGESYYYKNDLDNALAYAQRAIDIDHDLDKAFGDFSGISVKSSAGPFVLAGDVYRKKGDYEKSRENYTKALIIYPNSQEAQDGLDILNNAQK